MNRCLNPGRRQHKRAGNLNRLRFLSLVSHRVRTSCYYSTKEVSPAEPEPVFGNVYGAQESIPRN
jgi:hypothetical protein